MSAKVRKFDNANKANGYANNLKMDADTYTLRRRVIDVIYEAKSRLKAVGVELPRIDVRITEPNQGSKANVVGHAYLGQNVVYIPNNTITDSFRGTFFKQVVLHEIVHAVTSFRHDDKCPLMNPHAGINEQRVAMGDDEMYGHFIKYFK